MARRLFGPPRIHHTAKSMRLIKNRPFQSGKRHLDRSGKSPARKRYGVVKYLSGCLWPILLMAVLGVYFTESAEAQKQLFASPQGSAASANQCTNPADPCTLGLALTRVASTTTVTDEIAVLVPSAGASVTIDGAAPISLANNTDSFALTAYTYSDAGRNVEAEIVLRGGLTINVGGVISVGKNVTLTLKSDPLTLQGKLAAPAITGRVVLDGIDVFIEGTTGCPALEHVTARGRVDIVGSCTIPSANSLPSWLSGRPFSRVAGLGITHRLHVESRLRMRDDLALHVIAAYPSSSKGQAGLIEIADGAMITGQGLMQLGVDDRHKKDTDDCFQVKGDGGLDMAFSHATDAGVCIDVPELTSPNLSSNLADGWLFVRNASSMSGSFISDNRYHTAPTNVNGRARTEFWSLTRLEGNLEIKADGSSYANPVFVDADDDDNYDPDEYVECPINEEWGVHLFRGTTIEGDVTLTGMLVQTDDTYWNLCGPALNLRGVSNPAKPGAASANKAATQHTVVKGTYESRFVDHPTDPNPSNDSPDALGGLIYLGDHNFYHNIVLEGDANMTLATTYFRPDSETPIRGSDLESLLLNECVAERVDYDAPYVKLAGGKLQTIRVSETVAPVPVNLLVVDKPGAEINLSGSQGFSVDVLDLRAGTVTTGWGNAALLKINVGLALNHNQGDQGAAKLAPWGPQQLNLYKDNGGPQHVLYSGNATQTIGPEAAASLTELVVAKTDTAVVHLKDALRLTKYLGLVRGKLVLHKVKDNPAAGAGWLRPSVDGNATLSLGDDFTIVTYDGDFGYPEEAEAHGSIKLSTNAYRLIADDGATVRFAGQNDRTFGNIIPAFDTYEDAYASDHAYKTVQIHSACSVNGKVAHPIVRLSGANTVLYDSDLIDLQSGALDLAGQNLYLVNDNQVLDVNTRGTGTLCDSKAGQTCASTGSAHEIPFEEDTFDTDDYEPTVTVETRPARSRKYTRDHLIAAHPRLANLSKRNADAGTLYLRDVTERDDSRVDSILFNFYAGKTTFPNVDADHRVVRFNWAGTTRSGDRINAVRFPNLDVTDGLVEFQGGIDRIEIGTDLLVYEGTLDLQAPLDTSPIERKELIVGDLFWLWWGTVRAECSDITANWYYQGPVEYLEPAPAVLHLGKQGRMTVADWTYVAPDHSDAWPNQVRLNDACFARPPPAGTPLDVGLYLAGDVSYFGSGDVRNKDVLNPDEAGLRGHITFTGAQQEIVTGQHPDQQLGHVTLASKGTRPGTVRIASNIKQNTSGTLTMRSGHLESVGPNQQWTLLNAAPDSVNKRQSRPRNSGGAVSGGSRHSYVVNMPIRRAIRENVANDGTFGYRFPTGMRVQGADNIGVDYFRPITFQFGLDVTNEDTLSVEMTSEPNVRITWPDENLFVPGVDGTLELDNFGDLFWTVRHNRPAGHVVTPNVRIAAEGLPNVFDIKGLRLVQWDCNGTNARLAGSYDLTEGATETDGFNVNDVINGVPNITQQGVQVKGCTIIGIASSFRENPISIPAVTSGFARVLLTHSVTGLPVDVYVDDNKIANDWAFESAIGYAPIPAGPRKIIVTQATRRDTTGALLTVDLRAKPQQDYIVVIYGEPNDLQAIVMENSRAAAVVPNMVDVLIAHAATEHDVVDVRVLDERDNVDVEQILANNLAYGTFASYRSLSPEGFNVEITNSNNSEQFGVYRLELGSYAGSALVLALSGSGRTSADGLSVVGVTPEGNVFYPPVITHSAQAEALPLQFALHGNYPNPFNPSTRISLDLPDRADVTVQIVDLLGRVVQTVIERDMDAGANRGIVLSAGHLASGTYIYRVVARTTSDVHVETGRFVLLK